MITLPSVTIVAPCRNESSHIVEFFHSLNDQHYDKDKIEFIIIDGMSTDDTYEKLLELQKTHSNLQVLRNIDSTTPQALNIGIKQAKGDVIIRMDVHAIYPQEYIHTLVEQLIALKADNVGVPILTIPKKNCAKTVGISKAMSSSVAVGSSRFRTTTPKEPLLTDTVPFGCFNKEIFSRIGYFSELLHRNQDDEFNNRIIKNGGKIYLLPGPIVKYYGRSNFDQLTKMFFQYGVYKPLSNIICGRLSSYRQLAPMLFQLFVFSLIFLSAFHNIPFIILSGFLFIYLMAIIIFSIFLKFDDNFNFFKKIAARFYFIIGTILIHQSYGFGYFLGLFRVFFKKPINESTLTR